MYVNGTFSRVLLNVKLYFIGICTHCFHYFAKNRSQLQNCFSGKIISENVLHNAFILVCSNANFEPHVFTSTCTMQQNLDKTKTKKQQQQQQKKILIRDNIFIFRSYLYMIILSSFILLAN